MTEFKHIPKHSPKTKKPLVGLLLLASIFNCATLGYDSLMMAGLISVSQFQEYFSLNTQTRGLVNAGVWIGEIISCPLMLYLADKIGRKNCLYLSSIIIALGIGLQTGAQNIAMYSVARIIVGFGVGNASAAAPLLISEIATEKERGWLVGLYFTMFNVGAIVASAVTYGTVNIESTWSWRLPSIIQAVPSLLSIIVIPFIPESPRWKLLKGDYEYAREVFTITYGGNEDKISSVLNEVAMEIESEEKTMSKAYREFFTPTRAMFKRWAIVISLAWVVEMGGSSVGSYYLTVLLAQAGITSETKILQINMISSCWNLVISVAGAFFFDILGRKKQSLISLSGMIVCFFILGGFVKTYGSSTNTSGQYATIFWMFLFNAFYGFCYTPLTYLYPSELFPTRLRTIGTISFRFWNCGFGLLGSFVLSLAMDAVGWKFYMINAGYNIIFLPVIYFLWVETKNLALEEVATLFGDSKIEGTNILLHDNQASSRESQIEKGHYKLNVRVNSLEL